MINFAGKNYHPMRYVIGPENIQAQIIAVVALRDVYTSVCATTYMGRKYRQRAVLTDSILPDDKPYLLVEVENPNMRGRDSLLAITDGSDFYRVICRRVYSSAKSNCPKIVAQSIYDPKERSRYYFWIDASAQTTLSVSEICSLQVDAIKQAIAKFREGR